LSPESWRYSDFAISPVVEDEFATRDLFRSEAAQAYVSEERRLEKIRQ
jgi:hypothetical protein